MKKRNNESCLTRIPILGYFFRKIRENRQAIETTLKTGKATKAPVKERRFLWLFKIVSRKTFKPLKIK